MRRVLLAVFALYIQGAFAFPEPSRRQSDDFWRLYLNCLESNAVKYSPASSRMPDLFASDAFCRLRDFGPEIIGLLYQVSVSNQLDVVVSAKLSVPIEWVERGRKDIVGRLWRGSTLRYTSSFKDVDRVWGDESIAMVWRAGDAVATARSRLLVEEMRQAKSENRAWDERRAKGNLQLMGIFAFPILFEELSLGRDDVMEILAAEEWDGANKPVLTKEGLTGWWLKNKTRYELPKQADDYTEGPRLWKWKRTGR